MISYYIAAQPSIDRHLFSAALPTVSDLTGYSPGLKALTDFSVGGYHEVSFSPGGGYYVLQYKGPDVPWQKVVEAGNDGMSSLTPIQISSPHTCADLRQIPPN